MFCSDYQTTRIPSGGNNHVINGHQLCRNVAWGIWVKELGAGEENMALQKQFFLLKISTKIRIKIYLDHSVKVELQAIIYGMNVSISSSLHHSMYVTAATITCRIYFLLNDQSKWPCADIHKGLIYNRFKSWHQLVIYLSPFTLQLSKFKNLLKMKLLKQFTRPPEWITIQYIKGARNGWGGMISIVSYSA